LSFLDPLELVLGPQGLFMESDLPLNLDEFLFYDLLFDGYRFYEFLNLKSLTYKDLDFIPKPEVPSFSIS
jgi:hypothetical protein